MAILNSRFRCLLPLVIGSFCLIQGAALAMSTNPMAQLAGMALWLCLPACAYYAWRAFKSLSPEAIVTVSPPEPEGEASEPDAHAE
jgi:hypothetical protein